MLTLEQWEIERARLVAAQADIQSIIDALNASFSEGVVWDRTGVINNPTYSNGDPTVAATGVHALRSTVSPVLSGLEMTPMEQFVQVLRDALIGLGVFTATMSDPKK